LHPKDSDRFSGDENFLQFRIVPKMIMNRKRILAENENVLKRKTPKTKQDRN